jgi:hypothetical protein
MSNVAMIDRIFAALEESIRQVGGEIVPADTRIVFGDVRVAPNKITQALRDRDPDCQPVPATLLRKLGLPADADIYAVADAIDALFDAPKH